MDAVTWHYIVMTKMEIWAPVLLSHDLKPRVSERQIHSCAGGVKSPKWNEQELVLWCPGSITPSFSYFSLSRLTSGSAPVGPTPGCSQQHAVVAVFVLNQDQIIWKFRTWAEIQKHSLAHLQMSHDSFWKVGRGSGPESKELLKEESAGHGHHETSCLLFQQACIKESGSLGAIFGGLRHPHLFLLWVASQVSQCVGLSFTALLFYPHSVKKRVQLVSPEKSGVQGSQQGPCCPYIQPALSLASQFECLNIKEGQQASAS